MSEQRLPHSELKLMQEVDNEHVGRVEGSAKLLNKGILTSKIQYLSVGNLDSETNFGGYS